MTPGQIRYMRDDEALRLSGKDAKQLQQYVDALRQGYAPDRTWGRELQEILRRATLIEEKK